MSACINSNKKKAPVKVEKHVASISCEDNLWNEIVFLRKEILLESKNPKEELMQNFKTLDRFIFSFSSLRSIHKDSLSINAPLETVNNRVDKYNTFCAENIKKSNWERLNKFRSTSEYRSNQEYVCQILSNEILLYKDFGYTLESRSYKLENIPK